MTHQAADLLRAIADGKQMENEYSGRWLKASACEALWFINKGHAERVRIARPMVTRTVTYPEPLRESTSGVVLMDKGQWGFSLCYNFATEADAAEAHRALFGGGQ